MDFRPGQDLFCGQIITNLCPRQNLLFGALPRVLDPSQNLLFGELDAHLLLTSSTQDASPFRPEYLWTAGPGDPHPFQVTALGAGSLGCESRCTLQES